MGKCLSVEKKEEFNAMLTAFDLILAVADNNNLSTCDVVEELIEQCRMLTDSNAIEFFYSKTIANKKDPNAVDAETDHENDGITEAQYSGIPSNYTHFLSIKVQGMEFGKLAFDQEEISLFDERKIESLVAYTTQLIERNHLQTQAASIISVVEVQREHKRVSNIIENICAIISNTVRCDYVTIFKVDNNGTQKLRQLYPETSEINGFNHGIVGYVAQNKHFIVFNSESEKVSQGFMSLKVEEMVRDTIDDDDIESVLCVPVLNDDLKSIVGIVLCMNKLDDQPFTWLEVDMIQTLSIEIGHILEKFATKLFINDIIQSKDDSVKSLLKAYRASHVQGAPKISQILSPATNATNMVSANLQRLAAGGNKIRKASITISTVEQDGFLAKIQSNGKKMRRFSTTRSHTFHGPSIEKKNTLSKKMEDIQESRRSGDKNSQRDSASLSLNQTANSHLSISPAHSNNSIINADNRQHTLDDTSEKNSKSNSKNNSMIGLSGFVNKKKTKKKSKRSSVSLTVGAQVNLINLITDKANDSLKEIADFKFDPFEYELPHLKELIIKMFDEFDIIKSLKIPIKPFKTFIDQICEQYLDNPYHNVYHGFSVMGFSYAYLKQTDVGKNFSKLDILCLLIAGLCHDVNHPGNTNNFEIDTLSRLAIKHNDVSVLENHHCQITFKTLYKPECDFMTGFNNEDKKTFRKRVIRSILDTDMSHHFEMCSTLDQIEKPQFDQNLTNPAKNDKFIQMISGVLVHSADLSAPVQPLLLAIKWGKMICQEFTNQVEKEKELGIESLAMMKGLEENENFLKSQSGFFKFVLRPLFKSVTRLFPELKHLYLQLLNNQQYFESELERIQKEKTASLKSGLSYRRSSTMSINITNLNLGIIPATEHDEKSEDSEHQRSADFATKLLDLQRNIDPNKV